MSSRYECWPLRNLKKRWLYAVKRIDFEHEIGKWRFGSYSPREREQIAYSKNGDYHECPDKGEKCSEERLKT